MPPSGPELGGASQPPLDSDWKAGPVALTGLQAMTVAAETCKAAVIATAYMVKIQHANVGVPAVLAPIALRSRSKWGAPAVCSTQPAVSACVQPASQNYLNGLEVCFGRDLARTRKVDRAGAEVQVLQHRAEHPGNRARGFRQSVRDVVAVVEAIHRNHQDAHVELPSEGRLLCFRPCQAPAFALERLTASGFCRWARLSPGTTFYPCRRWLAPVTRCCVRPNAFGSA